MNPAETYRVLCMLVTALKQLDIDYVLTYHPRGEWHVSLNFPTDEATRAAATALGAELVKRRHEGQHWIEAAAILDGARLSIAGPHHALPRLEAVP